MDYSKRRNLVSKVEGRPGRPSTPDEEPACYKAHAMELEDKTDTQLVKLCLARDAPAWEELVRRHRRRVFNIAYQFVGRYDAAEDLSQELFIKIYHALDRYDRKRPFVSWLTRITRNLCIDNYRRRQRERELFSSAEVDMARFESSERSPYAQVRSREKAEFLRRGLSQLSPDLRTAVVLRDLEGYTYDEIARELAIPEGTVKSRINRGRLELARVLKLIESDEGVLTPKRPEPERAPAPRKSRRAPRRR